MPTRYMGSALKLGQMIGGEAGGEARKAVALKQLGSQLTFDRQMTFKLLEGGEGFTRNKDSSWNIPDYADTPEKAALGQRGYLNAQIEAYKNHLDMTSKSTTIAKNLWSGISDAIKEPNPRMKKELVNNYISLLYDVMPETAKNIRVEKYADRLRVETDVQEVRKKIQLDSLISAREEFTRTRDTNFLHDYTLAYMSDPEVAKNNNFPSPESLEKQYMSQETNKIEQERRVNEQVALKAVERRDIISQEVQKKERLALTTPALEVKQEKLAGQFRKSLAASFKLDLAQFADWNADQRSEYNSASNIGLALISSIPTKELNAVKIENIKSFAYAHRALKGRPNRLISRLQQGDAGLELRIDPKTGMVLKVDKGKLFRWMFGKWIPVKR